MTTTIATVSATPTAAGLIRWLEDELLPFAPALCGRDTDEYEEEESDEEFDFDFDEPETDAQPEPEPSVDWSTIRIPVTEPALV